MLNKEQLVQNSNFRIRLLFYIDRKINICLFICSFFCFFQLFHMFINYNMGNFHNPCCDARTQLDNAQMTVRIGEGVSPERLKDFSLPTESAKVHELIKKASQSKYYRKENAKTHKSEVVVYGGESNRVMYEGETVDDEASGSGKASFENGTLFQGTFRKGEPVNGIFIFNDYCYYVGDISSFQASGMGIYENIDNGYYYQGEWKKNLQNGKGIQKYSNKDEYEGGFMFGSKFGMGKYKFADGRIYEGSFYNGHSDGHGKMALPNGDFYEGEWKLGEMHGKGVYKWKNGEKYDGDYENGVRQGQGTYYFRSGARYVGSWVDGLQEGQGSIFEGYDEVKGQWKNGNPVDQ